MKKTNYLFFALLAVVLAGCKSTSGLDALLKTYPVFSQSQCQEKDGYWYKEKCWANFDDFDDNIAASDIDAEVDRQLAITKEFTLSLNKKDYKIDLYLPQADNDKKEMVFASLFTKDGKSQTLIQIAPLDAMNKHKFSVQSQLFDADLTTIPEDQAANSYLIAQGEGNAVRTGDDKEEPMVLSFTGQLTSKKDASTIPYNIKVGTMLTGMGSTTLERKGNEAYLNGILGIRSYKQFKDLIKNHPEVKTIVLENVPGSMNDAVNMHTGRLIKNAGLSTKVLANSEIASGGVDLFCSGRKRIVTEGAKIGVHSWSGGDYTAAQLPKDHPAHQDQIEYYNEVLGSPQGEDFYFYTLQAAPFDSVHQMSIDEIKKWNVATQIVDR